MIYVRLLWAFATGYLMAYMMKIITSTTQGEKAMPDWPDFTDWSDVSGPLFQAIGTVLACMAPALLILFFVDDYKIPLFLIAGLIGGIYLPMAFLAVTMFDSLAAINPMLV